MTEIRKIDVTLDKRVETGPLQIGEDWPGIFIRGDNAAYYAMCLESYLNGTGQNDAFIIAACRNLVSDLRSCRV